MSKTKVSCTIIGKNEVNDIETCLNSVVNVCDEIIYTDTGSTDGTIELIKSKFPTVKIFRFEWCDDFSKARNFCMSKAKKSNTHILYLDCDEQLHLINGKFPDNLDEALFNFDIRNLTEENTDTQYVNSVCSRLAANVSGLSFINPIHEIFASTKKHLPIKKFEWGYIVHKGYLASYRKEKNKSERNTEMLEIEYAKCAKPQVNFYLGQEHFINSNYERTRDLALEGITLIDPNNALDMTFSSLLYHALISAYIAMNDEPAIKEFEEKYTVIADNPEVHQSLMNYYLSIHDECKAVYHAYQTLKYGNAVVLPAKFIEKNIKFTPYITLAQYFINVKKDKLMGLYWLELTYGSGVDDLKLIIDIYNLLPKGERTLDKWEYFNRKIYEKTKDTNILKDLIGCYILNKDDNKNKVAMNLANDLLDDNERQGLKTQLVNMNKAHLIELLK